ncbi:hypothetical protein IJI02_01435 [Candidatus Saccharibacteria bacterium]|nr:hypothetical protein [Candidatus Saccharibacteria bacterium]
MKITHLTRTYQKITKLLALAIVLMVGVLLVLNDNSTRALDDKIVVPIPTIIEGKEILHTDPTDPVDWYAEDYLENYDETIMSITSGGHFVGVGNQFFTIEITDEDYIFEGNVTSVEYMITIYPNIPKPYISSETTFEYDGEEHCVDVVYQEKQVSLSSVSTRVDNNPPICATAPGTYHIYAFLVVGFNWVKTDHDLPQDLVWEIVAPETELPKAPNTGTI